MKNYAKGMSLPTASGSGQIETIDFLRGIASIIILIAHYKHFYMGPSGIMNNGSDISSFYLYDVISPVSQYGSNAVQLFWVISGFIFMHVYGGSLNVSGKRYLWHRFSRLYPLHLLTLILIAIAQYGTFIKFNEYSIYHSNDWAHFILNLVFASEWFRADLESLSFNGPIWSVSVEMFSYLLFLFLIKNSFLSFKNMIFICVTASVIHFNLKNVITLCVFYFFVGCLANAFFSHMMKYVTLNKIIVMSIFCVSSTLLISFIPIKVPSMITYSIGFSSLIIGLVALEYKGLMKWLNGFKWVGNTSYGNYLWHSPLQVVFLYLCGIGYFDINNVNATWFFFAYIAVVIFVSLVSYHGFERPAQKYLNSRLSAY